MKEFLFSKHANWTRSPNMEGLTRLVSESLVRHGFDRPLDYRRLQWSRWFRCDSHHSLLCIPSKAGVFAVAEEITEIAKAAKPALSAVEGAVPQSEASGPLEAVDAASRIATPARMLAVTQFFEADDMAFVLDRMLSRPNPMRECFESGRYFVRFVAIEDSSQRRSIATSLNQWVASQAEMATGLGSYFFNSLELTPATEHVPQASVQPSLFDAVSAGNAHVSRALMPATADTKTQLGLAEVRPHPQAATPHLDSSAASNIHCPSPLPSGF
jgi:hypothetical protein